MRRSNPGSDRLELLYQGHGRQVLAFAQRRTGNRADAEEVLAETFVVCWRRLADVPEGDGALRWLYVVAGGIVANQRRAQRRQRALSARLATLPSTHSRSAEGEDLLDEALTLLRADDRTLLRLAAWEGLGPTELAKVLGCTPNAAAIRLHRSKRRLQHTITALRASEHLRI